MEVKEKFVERECQTCNEVKPVCFFRSKICCLDCRRAALNHMQEVMSGRREESDTDKAGAGTGGEQRSGVLRDDYTDWFDLG